MKKLHLFFALATLALLASCAEKLTAPQGSNPEALSLLVLGPDTVRAGDQFTLLAYASGGSTPYAFSWELDQALIGGLPYYDGRIWDTGSYSYSVVANSQDGQVASGTKTLQVIPVDSAWDTLIVIDTLWIPDSLHQNQWCGRIEGPIQEINWLLMNDSGNFRLEFELVAEEQQPPQTLFLMVGEVAYEWDCSQNYKELELTLGVHTRISIVSGVPHARGHGIDVCLKLTRR